jgi:hypothetical protein
LLELLARALRLGHVETSVGPALGLEVLPYWHYNELRTASSVRLLLADPGIPSILSRIRGPAAALVHALLYDGHAFTAVVHGLGVRAQQLWSAKPLPA